MVASEKQYAGFWYRFWAFYIDQLLLLVIIAFTEKIFSLSMTEGANGIVRKIEALCTLSIIFGYFCFFESSQLQATVGKKLLGIRVTDVDGNRISILRSAARTLAKFPSFFIFLIGFLMQVFTKKRQALHDIMAGCLVEKYKESGVMLLILITLLLLPIVLLLVLSSIVASPSFLITLMSVFSK